MAKQATVINPTTGQRKVVNVGDPNAFAGGFQLDTGAPLQNTLTGTKPVDRTLPADTGQLSNFTGVMNLLQQANISQQPSAADKLRAFNSAMGGGDTLDAGTISSVITMGDINRQTAVVQQARTAVDLVREQIAAKEKQREDNQKWAEELFKSVDNPFKIFNGNDIENLRLGIITPEIQTKIQNAPQKAPTIKEQMDLLAGGYELGQNGLVQQKISSSPQNILSAIKAIESGGNYNARGASGEIGAYQFMPATWSSWSSGYLQSIGKNPNQALLPTPDNQDKVAGWKINQLFSQGYTPQQIASIWNSGQPEWQGKVGVNKFGAKYNVPAYVDKFTNALQRVSALGETKNDYMGQLQILSPGLPSDATRKEASNSLNKYIQNGDNAGAERYLDGLAYQTLKGKQKDDFASMNTLVGEVSVAKGNFDSFQSSNPNLYKSIIQKNKPLLAVSKDKKWLSFVAQVSNAQTRYQNQLFGAALTPTETEQAKRFLVNFDVDTAGDALVKLNELQGLATRVQKRLLNEQKGIFESPGMTPGGNITEGTTSSGIKFKVIKE